MCLYLYSGFEMRRSSFLFSYRRSGLFMKTALITLGVCIIGSAVAVPVVLTRQKSTTTTTGTIQTTITTTTDKTSKFDRNRMCLRNDFIFQYDSDSNMCEWLFTSIVRSMLQSSNRF